MGSERWTGWIAGIAAVAAIACGIMGTTGCSGGDDADKGEAAAITGGDANRVLIKTNKGTIEIELYPDKAPTTVDNFLAYVDSGFYDGTLFHRVIEDFVIQGGGYTPNEKGSSPIRKDTLRDPIENEADNGLKNETGTIAMARTSAPHSATSQFFINLKDNANLDFKSETPQGWGYTVFGRVVDGMDVVRVIEQSPTKDLGGAFRELPKESIVIESITRK